MILWRAKLHTLKNVNVINKEKEKKNMQMLGDLCEKMNFNSDRIKLFFNYNKETIEKGVYFSLPNEDGQSTGNHALIKITGLDIKVNGLSLTTHYL